MKTLTKDEMIALARERKSLFKRRPKNLDPAYSRQGTRANGKKYGGPHQNLKRVDEEDRDDKYVELDCD